GFDPVQLRLLAIEPGLLVSQRPCITSQAFRTADRFKEQVSCGIVAISQSRLAKSGQSHSPLVDMLLCHGRILEQICLRVRSKASELVLLIICQVKNSGGGKQLECAAQGEAFICAVLQALSRVDLERGNSEVTSKAFLNGANAFLGRTAFLRSRTESKQLREGQQRNGRGKNPCGLSVPSHSAAPLGW